MTWWHEQFEHLFWLVEMGNSYSRTCTRVHDTLSQCNFNGITSAFIFQTNNWSVNGKKWAHLFGVISLPLNNAAKRKSNLLIPLTNESGIVAHQPIWYFSMSPHFFLSLVSSDHFQRSKIQFVCFHLRINHENAATDSIS